MSQLTENQEETAIPEARRCVFVFPDGRRCRMRRWGAKLCFHHDPAAAQRRKNRGKPLSRLDVLTATEVHEILNRTLMRLLDKEITPGEAYATGYLAQLLLGNLKKVEEEFGRARTEWDHNVEVISRVRGLTEPADEEAEAASEPDEK